MARPADRLRLKDKLVDNLSKSIKSIQEFIYYQTLNNGLGSPEEGNIVIDNGNHACHKLLDSLDHAFLHGVRNVTHGYWRVVRQLSHKGMVKEIETLPNVTTDLGRGRAWLHASLNEGLLESYIRMLCDNEKLLKKHYAKDSLVMDGDKMHVLMTLTSGLDFVTFQLEYDLPYLDLSPSPPRSRADFHDEDDSSSIQSSTSLRSSLSETRLSPPVARLPVQSDSDSTSIGSFDVHSQGDGRDPRSSMTSLNDPAGLTDSWMTSRSNSVPACGEADMLDSKNGSSCRHPSFSGKLRSITPTDSTSISSLGSAGGDVDRHKRLENIILENEDPDYGDTTLEVIRVRGKKSGNKSKRKKSRSSSTSAGSTNVGENSTSNLQKVPSEKDDVGGVCRPKSGSELSDKHPIRTSDTLMDDRHSVVTADNQSDLPSSLSHIDSSSSQIDTLSSPSTTQTTSVQNRTSAEFVEESILPGGDNGYLSKAGGDNQVVGSNASSPVQISAFLEIEQRIAALCGPDNNGAETSQETASYPTATATPTAVSMQSSENKNGFDAESSKNDYYQTSTSPSSSSFRNEISSSNSSALSSVTTDRDLALGQKSNNDIAPSKSMERNQFDPFHGNGDQQNASIISVGSDHDNEEDNFDFYSSSYHDKEEFGDISKSSEKSKKEDKESEKLSKFHDASNLQDYMDFILKAPDSPPGKGLAVKDIPETPPQLDVSLDNNMKLQVMLEIFKQEDESYIKMFVSWENHTEGDPSIAYVLVSDQYLYILHFKRQSRKFIVQSTTRLVDIIFISTGLYDQTLNIESRGKSRQKQRLWLTPGNQALTRAIVECLTDAVKSAMENFASVQTRFSVGSDVPLQKIGLRKYLSKQLHCESLDVEIHDYSLVYWEDPSSSSSGSLDAVTKEGMLLLHTQDPLKGFVWKPVYVVLRSGMLCISNNKSDLKPHTYLGLGGDQCIGCRRTAVGDRENCVELVLAQAGSWFLSAASSLEMIEWSTALCLAVSQGMQEEGSLTDCSPCCCVLACNKIFMCHEDLNTRFFRTLGHAQAEDVTGISIDETERTYCIVEFESTEAGVSSGQWVFYFASATDATRFTTALDKSWKDIYQVELPITVLNNVTLQHHCQSRVKHLRNALAL